MTNTSTTEPEMTDVFSRFSAPLPPLPQPVDGKNEVSDRKKAALATAAVLLGGGAAFAAVNFDSIREYAEGIGEDADTIGSDSAPLRHNAPSAVQNGTITPGENIAIAAKVEEEMGFGQAYDAAREEVGPGGIFSWHGQVYNTYTLEEWQGLSLGQRQEFLGEVGYQPAESSPVNEEVTETQEMRVAIDEIEGINDGITDTDSESSDQTPAITLSGENGSDDDSILQDIEPAYFDLMIDGRPAIGIDDDHDGIADAIVFIDEATNSIVAFVDAEEDNRIDTIIQFDSATQQIVGQQAIAEPFVAEITKLEAVDFVMNAADADDLPFVAVSNEAFDDDYYTDESGYVNDADMLEMD